MTSVQSNKHIFKYKTTLFKMTQGLFANAITRTQGHVICYSVARGL